MEWFGRWILSIAAAGIVSSLCTLLAPESGKRAVRFAGGLLICLAVLLPLRSLSGFDPMKVLSEYEAALEGRIRAITPTGAVQAGDILASQTSAYVEQRAAALGVACTAKITYSTDADGLLSPYSAVITYEGGPSAEKTGKISELLETELGIPPDRQLHK